MNPQHEATIRITAFLSVLAIMGLWEWVAPRRPLTARKLPRWGAHLALVIVNNLTARLLLPLSAVAMAERAEARSWGLLSLVEWPVAVEAMLAIVALDFAIWASHVFSHRIPLLWRFHKVHHADLDLDVTSGIRFHTGEILLSALYKLAVIGLLGASPWSVVIFETLLNATALFNHSNVRIPLSLDRGLRWFLVTPDMHRVHHSTDVAETNTNFGFNIPWWDRLFGLYRDQPAQGHDGMTIGLAEYREERQVERLGGILLLPMTTPASPAGIND